MMTDLATRINISWKELNELEFHTFQHIYESIAESMKAIMNG